MRIDQKLHQESMLYRFEFTRALVEREIKARYKRALFGFLWSVLNPLAQMIVIGVVFRFFIPVPVENYFLFLLSGLLPWNFFSFTLSQATQSVVQERNLIRKARFPRESLVFSIIIANLIHLIIALLVLLILLLIDKIFIDQYSVGRLVRYIAHILLVFPAMVWLTALTTGIALFTAALNVKYRDIHFFVQAILPLWFYATPITYNLNLLPPTFRVIEYFNPLTAIMELMQFAVVQQRPVMGNLWLVSFVFTLLIVSGGILVFQKMSLFFDDWL